MMRKMLFAIPVFLILSVRSTYAEHRSRRPASTYKNSTGLNLPNNATSIRENIKDTFSCDNRIYGYYADIDNECQIFHVCSPQARRTIRFSFICPAETVFNQVTFVCTRTDDSIPCEESENYYELNKIFGKVDENSKENVTASQGNEINSTTHPTKPSKRPTKPTKRPMGESTPYPTKPSSQPTMKPQTSSTPYPQKPSTRPTTIPELGSTPHPQKPSVRPTLGPQASLSPYPPKPPTRPPTFPTFLPDYQTTWYPLRPTQHWQGTSYAPNWG